MGGFLLRAPPADGCSTPPAMPTGRSHFALVRGMAAFPAEEHGLIGSTFTTADYNAMTAPIRGVASLHPQMLSTREWHVSHECRVSAV